ncbi:MAG: hypothetical protein JO057_14910, partial [Chloroflexi bacterium]|nr:hypothetical protein [Chloroflexota bacterium]
MNDSTRRLTRRGFVAAASLGIPLVIEACAPATPTATTAPTPTTASTPAGVASPRYVPFVAQTQPDLAGNTNGLDPAYYKFPAQLTQTVTQTPGDGSDVSAIVVLTYSPPPPVDQNAAWQAVNKQLGANLKLQMMPSADYAASVNTVLAGSDLPDFIYNATTTQPLGVIPAITQFATTRCTDLTPYLSGDAIKDYPNLANFSTYTWRSAAIAGKLYAIPSARAPVGTALAYRKDLFDQAGVQMDNAPKNGDDFKQILQALTRPDQNQWGISCAGASTFGLNSGSAFLAIFRTPNNWKLDPAGNLIKDYEADEFKQAVGYARDLWAAGVYHPNTPTYGGNGNPDYAAGRFAVQVSVWGQYIQNWDLLASVNQNGKTYPMHPFAADGGSPVYLAGNGNFGITFIKQQPSVDRVKMLLRVANFFAAPFGSQEWLLNYYGVKDQDYQFDAVGTPVQTDQGRAELTATWRYITSPPYALFDSVRSQEFATVAHAAEDAMLAAAQFDPTLGLQSSSAFQLGIPAQTTFYAGVQDIVLGRRPLSDLDGLVADWRTAAGDKMRGEYLDAL